MANHIDKTLNYYEKMHIIILKIGTMNFYKIIILQFLIYF